MGEAFFRTLQVDLDEWGQKKVAQFKLNCTKVLFIICYYVAKCEGDAYIVVSGDNNMGKSNFSIRSAKMMSKMLRKFFGINSRFMINRDVFFTPTKDDINELQDDKSYQIKVFDEGYFLGMNLDFNVELAKETTRVAMGTRSKHNIIFFNFQKPTRATKTLLERFKIMFIKPTKPDALLLCRSSLSILSKDTWGLEPILKAENDRRRVWEIKKNQHYIRGVMSSKLSKKNEEKFQRLQKIALKARKDKGKPKEKIKTEYENLAGALFYKEKKGLLAYSGIKDYLMKAVDDPELAGLGFRESQAKSFLLFYNKYSTSRKIKETKMVEPIEQIPATPASSPSSSQ